MTILPSPSRRIKARINAIKAQLEALKINLSEVDPSWNNNMHIRRAELNINSLTQDVNKYIQDFTERYKNDNV